MTYSPTVFNNSLQLDGVDDYVALPAMIEGGAFTFEACVYSDDVRIWNTAVVKQKFKITLIKS